MEQILIVKLSAIGDVVQTLPALEALKRTYPHASIDWVVEEAAANLLEGHPLIRRLLVSRRKTWLRMLGHPGTFLRGWRELRSFVSGLRSVRYDAAVDFQGLLKSGVIMCLARADRKIGFSGGREMSSLFLNERLPAYDKEQHALERYLALARHLGAVDPAATCALPIDRERTRIRERLLAAGRKGPVVVLNPVARWGTKLWREDRFAKLADRLIRERNAVAIFTGSPADQEIIGRITGMMEERPLNWAGQTTLKELAALAGEAELFITTDTGPMHIAAAAGARVVALFGPTAPWRTGPHGAGHVVIRKELPCAPCFARSCSRETACMQAITVDDVMAQLPLWER